MLPVTTKLTVLVVVAITLFENTSAKRLDVLPSLKKLFVDGMMSPPEVPEYARFPPIETLPSILRLPAMLLVTAPYTFN